MVLLMWPTWRGHARAELERAGLHPASAPGSSDGPGRSADASIKILPSARSLRCAVAWPAKRNERTRRHVELTPAGQALLEQSKKIFQELETARIEVKRHGTGQKGLLRIGCEDGTTFTILPPLLQNFQEQYPNVRCSIVTQSMADQIVAVRSGDLDAGILPLPPNDPDLELIKLGSCSMITAFAAHLPLAGKERLQLRDLRHQPVVALPEDSDNLYAVILPYLKKRRISVNLVRGAFDLTTLLLMAASGLGVALVPSSYRECGPPGLVYREIADSTLDLSVGLAWKRGTAKAVVTNFVRVVRDMSVPAHS